MWAVASVEGTMPEDLDEVMLATDVAQRYRVSIWTVYQLAKAGELQHKKVGKQLRFLRSHVEAYLRGGRAEAQP